MGRKKDYTKLIESLEWNVMDWDHNADELRTHNIFHNGNVIYFLNKVLNNKNLTKEEFTEEVKSMMRYSYWCKAECEIIVESLFQRGNWDAELTNTDFIIKPSWYTDVRKDIVMHHNNIDSINNLNLPLGNYYIQARKYDTSKKIDIYYQLEMNMDRLIDYILEKTGYKPLEDKWEKK